MADTVPSSSTSPDACSWIQWIIEYINDKQAENLDFRTVRDYGLILDTSNVDPVFDALVGSKITSIHFGNRPLTNKLQYLSKRLTRTNIVKLNLAGCTLTVDDVLSLLAVLKNTHVTELDIARNGLRLENKEIQRFVTLLAKSNLKSLSLEGNAIIPLEKISIFFRRLPDTQLTCLNLSYFFVNSGYRFNKKRRRILNTLLKKLPHTAITELNLDWNELSNSFAKALAVVLENTKLEKLYLVYNKLTDSGIDLLLPALTRSKITHLDISSNLIEGNNSLGNFLKDTKITELNLSNIPITDGRMFSGPNFLQGSALNSLKLSYCCKNTNAVPLPIRDLAFSELTHLDLANNMLNLEQVSALEGVLGNSKLTHLDLSGNEFSEQCYNILGEFLKNSVLKYINLSETARSYESVRGIASFLDKTKGLSIVSIGLRCNKLNSAVDIISSALENTTFLELDLSFNNFKSGVDSLAEVFKSTALVALSLDGNYIGDDSTAILAKCLEETKIVVLDLRNNSITDMGATALALSLKNTKLRSLHLERNEITDDGLESLAKFAENSCVTDIRVEICPWHKIQIIGRMLWQNHKKIRRFADLLNQTAFFTGDSGIFEFDRQFNGVNISVFIEDFLKLYKILFEEQYLVSVIEQDKFILDLKKHKCCKVEQGFKGIELKPYVGDCELIFTDIIEHPSPVKNAGNYGASFFKNQVLWLILDKFPRQFVDFMGKRVEAGVNQHVAFLKKVDGLGLTGIVELLLLNRPKFVIDESLDILHPRVYELLHKYKQPVCNLDIEPKGVEKIVEYFRRRVDLDGASEVISLLTNW